MSDWNETVELEDGAWALVFPSNDRVGDVMFALNNGDYAETASVYLTPAACYKLASLLLRAGAYVGEREEQTRQRMLTALLEPFLTDGNDPALD